MSSCLFVDANLGAPRVCVVACKRTVAVVVAVEVAVPVAVAGAEPRSSSRSGTSRAAIRCGLWNLWVFGFFGVLMFWTSVLEFGSPNMFWILVLSSCVGSWTSTLLWSLDFSSCFGTWFCQHVYFQKRVLVARPQCSQTTDVCL